MLVVESVKRDPAAVLGCKTIICNSASDVYGRGFSERSDADRVASKTVAIKRLP